MSHHQPAMFTTDDGFMVIQPTPRCEGTGLAVKDGVISHFVHPTDLIGFTGSIGQTALEDSDPSYFEAFRHAIATGEVFQCETPGKGYGHFVFVPVYPPMAVDTFIQCVEDYNALQLSGGLSSAEAKKEACRKNNIKTPEDKPVNDLSFFIASPCLTGLKAYSDMLKAGISTPPDEFRPMSTLERSLDRVTVASKRINSSRGGGGRTRGQDADQ